MSALCVCQVFGTAMLLLCLMALSDQKNKPAAAGSEPVAVGLLVMLIGISLGSNSGYAINPTRDIAPRVFTAIAGWGAEVFRYTGRMYSHIKMILQVLTMQMVDLCKKSFFFYLPL